MAMAAGTAVAAANAQQYHTDFDPASLKGPKVGGASQLLVLGSPHLSQLPAAFAPAALDSLIDRLRAWKPQAIAIEALSGPQCDFLRHYPDRYRDTISSYCWDTSPANTATRLSVTQATAEIDRSLAAWPAKPTPGQRRHLAALFLAGGEQASALVQWLRLSPADRSAGDGLNAALVAHLDALRTRRNETMLIAAPLAALLGQERVHAIDDHTADSVVVDEAYGSAISKAWDNPATAARHATSAALEKDSGTGTGILNMYRAYNAPGQGKLAFDSDFGAALEEPSPQKFGRHYLGYWETRNLRMAGNIRDMLAPQPGIRALVIVGASHKAYLEAYLDQMHDIQLADSADILG
ncbi:DUF5694 domain-containing protein [Sphingomonas sp. UYAg733]